MNRAFKIKEKMSTRKKKETRKSIVERFKNRRSPSETVKIYYPNKKDPEIIIEANRPSEEELRIPTLKAIEASRTGKSDYTLFEDFLSLLKKHALDWDMEDVEFSRETFIEFVDSFDAVDMLQMTTAYRQAISTEEEEGLGKS